MNNITAIVCTRSAKRPVGFPDLITYFLESNINLLIQNDKSSIFSAYGEAIKNFSDPEQILIFCHDDIEILNSHKDFTNIIVTALNKPGTGFVGVAGTRHLGTDAVWWNHTNWANGKHRGFIFHGKNKWECYPTGYTTPTATTTPEVVVLDGVFLACKLKTIQAIGSWEKPETFQGNWDFYDIYYTWKAHKAGFVNRVVPIVLVHNSAGELVGRDSWIKNQKAFINLADLPEIII